MTRKPWLSIVALAVGLALMVVAGFAAPAADAGSEATKSADRRGGTYIVEFTTDVDYTDPALDYLSTGWEIMYAVCAKLVDYPHANAPRGSQLVPAVATGMPRVSSNGRQYTFTIRKGIKFNNGANLTALNFKRQIERLADPKMQSPATPFIEDIVGAKAKIEGKAGSVTGVFARGQTIRFNLTKRAPDFLARLAMPFFCAVPTDLPVDANGVETFASAGPYYISARTVNKSITLKRNPNYKPALFGRARAAANFDTIQFNVGNSLEAIRLNVESNRSDFAGGGIPPAAYAEIAQKYGVNKGRFYVKPQLGVSYLAFNHDRPLFKAPSRGACNGCGNVALKKAINFAIDRKALLAQGGFLAGKRTDQILPPGMAGFRDADLYPLKGPNLKAAKRFANGNLRGGKAVLYTSNRGAAPLQAQIFQFNLKQIGIDLEVKQFARAVQIEKEGTRGEPFDLTTEGWIADYADPYDFIDILLNGKNIHESHNNNVAYFNSPVFNRRMEQASALSGAKRYATYGQLDVDLMKNGVPWAARNNFNSRIFVSNRTGCFSYSPVFSFDYASLCLK